MISAPRIDDVRTELKSLILEHFLAPDQDPEELTDTTPLVTSWVFDPLHVLRLVSMLEERYEIEFDACDVDVLGFDTIEQVADQIVAKASRAREPEVAPLESPAAVWQLRQILS
jgi:acyl carrier protein